MKKIDPLDLNKPFRTRDGREARLLGSYGDSHGTLRHIFRIKEGGGERSFTVNNLGHLYDSKQCDIDVLNVGPVVSKKIFFSSTSQWGIVVNPPTSSDPTVGITISYDPNTNKWSAEIDQ